MILLPPAPLFFCLLMHTVSQSQNLLCLTWPCPQPLPGSPVPLPGFFTASVLSPHFLNMHSVLTTLQLVPVRIIQLETLCGDCAFPQASCLRELYFNHLYVKNWRHISIHLAEYSPSSVLCFPLEHLSSTWCYPVNMGFISWISRTKILSIHPTICLPLISHPQGCWPRFPKSLFSSYSSQA